MKQNRSAATHHAPSRAAAHTERSGHARKSALPAGPQVLQPCWKTTKKRVPLLPAPKAGTLTFTHLTDDTEVKRLSPAQHFGYWHVEVVTGPHATKQGYIKFGEIDKVVIKEKEKEEEEKPTVPNAFAELHQGQQEALESKKRARAWSSSVSNELKGPGLPDKFQSEFGGSTDVYDFSGVRDFDTPPGSPDHGENDSRKLVDQDIDEDEHLVINLAEDRKGKDLKDIGSQYDQYHLYPKNTNHDLNKDDRRHIRGSTYLFNTASDTYAPGLLKATPLSETEETNKDKYLEQIRKHQNNVGKGGAYLHEPDQQFLPKGQPAREKGGSLLGTHFGTKPANSLTGQFLHPDHPQFQKAVSGVKGILVKEKDGKTYRYGPPAAKRRKTEEAEEKPTESPKEERKDDEENESL